MEKRQLLCAQAYIRDADSLSTFPNDRRHREHGGSSAPTNTPKIEKWRTRKRYKIIAQDGGVVLPEGQLGSARLGYATR